MTTTALLDKAIGRKKATPEKRTAMLVVIDGGEVLLQQRPQTGIWGGLLSLPEVGGHVAMDEDQAPVCTSDVAAAAGVFGTLDEVRPLSPLVHVFTHYKLHIAPFAVTLATRASLPSNQVWWKLGEIERAPLPAPVKKLLLDLATPNLFDC